MKKCKLSIITVTFNNLAGLTDTYHSIRSILTSRGQDVEWVVVDGDSTDGSKCFLKRCTDEITNIIFLSEPDKGIYDAMNKGVNLANGSLVWFLNAGDQSCLTSQLLDELNADVDAIFANVNYRYGEMKYVRKSRRLSYANYGMPSNHQGTIYARSFLLENPYPLKFGLSQDYWLSAQLYIKKSSTRNLDQCLAEFHVGGVSTTRFWQVCSDMAAIQKDVLCLSNFKISLHFLRRLSTMTANYLLHTLTDRQS